MARARNIKPGFFENEDLAECSPFARLCFVGLWTLADREGRLEDRPKRIKGKLFSFDSIEAEPLLKELQRHGFIDRYTVGEATLSGLSKYFARADGEARRWACRACPPSRRPGGAQRLAGGA